MSLRVIRLGGSLLELPDVAGRLRHWLAAQPAATNVLVVGGGQLADVVRAFDRRQGLAAADAHWLAVGAMELNARMIARLLPEAVWLDWPAMDRAQSVAELVRVLASPRLDGQTSHVVCYGLSSPPLAILNPTRLLEHDEQIQAARRLPMNWHVTSDSIAARAAEMLDADELVLLKSADPPDPPTIEAVVAAGYVDTYFGEASRCVRRIRYVNLRRHEATCSGGPLLK